MFARHGGGGGGVDVVSSFGCCEYSHIKNSYTKVHSRPSYTKVLAPLQPCDSCPTIHKTTHLHRVHTLVPLLPIQLFFLCSFWLPLFVPNVSPLYAHNTHLSKVTQTLTVTMCLKIAVVIGLAACMPLACMGVVKGNMLGVQTCQCMHVYTCARMSQMALD